jgi:peroxiredoxin family protein
MGGVADVAELSRQVEALRDRVDRQSDPNALALVVFSGELDKMLAAFVIATGAAACGMRVSMFFTFWSTAALKKGRWQATGKSLVERALGWMLPGGSKRQKLSKLDFGGLGRQMMAREMRKKNVPDLDSLIDVARELGVQQHICEMSMSLLGIREQELIDYPDRKICGVAHFLEVSSCAGTTLFI